MARPAGSSSHVRLQSGYRGLLASVASLLEQARKGAAGTVNSITTVTYWEVGRRIVEHEPQGKVKPGYGDRVIQRLATDLTARLGRGFSRRNVFQMRQFYLFYRGAGLRRPDKALPHPEKLQTPSAPFLSKESSAGFPLPWSHYVRLLAVENSEARAFFEAESLPGGWSVRQLDRQIATLAFERTARSRRALIGDRKALQHASGQMNLYLNYDREHWTNPDEHPPVGLILCSEKDEAVAHHAPGNLANKVLAREYKLALPTEKELARELARQRRALQMGNA